MKIIINCCIAITLIAVALFVGGSTEVQAATCTVTNLNDSGPGSLREAISCANANPGPDIITFDVVGTINVLTQLPTLSDTTGGTTIDGTTAPGYAGAPVVILQGPGTGYWPGLKVTSAGNQVRALQIGSFWYGIEIDGTAASNNAITGCYIGTDGTIAFPNLWHGIMIHGGASSNRIGTDGDGVADETERNVISGNGDTGVYIWGGYGDPLTPGNIVAGNYIGTDASGTVALGNGNHGVYVSYPVNTRIGTDGDGIGDAAERNMISGNVSDGINISTGLGDVRSSIIIAGNYIGTNAEGTAALGNGGYGIRGSGNDQESNTRIGTNGDGIADEAERNIISGNTLWGVSYIVGGAVVAGNYIGTDVTGTAALPNMHGLYLGGQNNRIGTNGDGIADEVERNVISSNSGYGLRGGGTNLIVAGNYVGTDVTGTIALGNGYEVEIGYGDNVRIGTNGDGIADEAERNIFSNSGRDGLGIKSGCTNVVVAGNYIGTDVTSTRDFGNASVGVSFGSSVSGRIGINGDGVGDDAERNIISSNGGSGVYVGGSSVTVAGNYIGTDVSGTIALGNSRSGVIINGPSNKVGGTTAGTGNVISGNGEHGIEIGRDGNVVQGNYVGTDVTGTVDLGNSQGGVYISYASNNTIGGTATGAGNVISGNDSYGIRIGSNSTGNVVQGNFIGTSVNGAVAVSNGGHGVIAQGSDNTIGGTATGASNTIAFNGGYGVVVVYCTGNSILRNSIFSNTDLGIDLYPYGVTPNDEGDDDTGTNNLQNFPVLTSATSGATSTTIEGTLNSTANTDFTLEFFANTACDPSGFGEGETLLGSETVTTDGSGNVSFTVTFATPVPLGDFITGTATDPNDNTSEFSECEEVMPANQPPVANDDNATTNEDTPVDINVLANDTDPDGDSLTVDSVTQGTKGSVTNNGTDVTYTPDADYCESDSFTYTVSDGNGGTDTATVDVTVTCVNDAPVAVGDSATTDEDTAVTIDVLANDSDVDGDSLTVALVTQGTNGSVTNNGSDVTYTSDANFCGSDSFTYTVSDGNGGTDTATVDVTVTCVNDAPVAVDDTATMDEDTAVTIDVLANDSDVDGDALTVASVTQGTNGSVTNNGTDVTYTPDVDYCGSDSFTYTVSDGNGGTDTATVNVTVACVNDTPVAEDDTYGVEEDDTLTVAAPGVLDNDSDVDGDPLTAVPVTDVSNGTLSLSSDGSFTYTADPDFNDTDNFTYKANDGATDSNIATVTITVNPVNDAPVAANDSATTDEDTAVTIDVLANDSDVDGDALTVASVIQGTNGSVTNNSTDVTYTPDADYCGSDSFTYTVSDGNGGTDTATVDVTVTCVNDAPMAEDDTYSVDEDDVLTVIASGVLGNDGDVEGDTLTAVLVTGTSDGTLTLNADGSFTYTPDADFNGTDSFTYKASDGTDDSNIATVTITVNPVADAPVAEDDTYGVDEDDTLTVAAPGVLTNDSDADGDTLTAILVSGPSDGTLTFSADGSFSYTPGANFNGTDSFTYKANDGDLDSNVATVTITVNPVNDAPVAVHDVATTQEDTPVTIAVLANDSDLDADALAVESITQPANGSVTNNGTDVTYTPDADYCGSDSFTYTVSDGNGGTDTATVDITVTCVNDAPVAEDDAYSMDEDDTLTVTAPGVLGNDSDVEGETLTAVLVTGTSDGALILNADGSFTYTPDANFNGTDTFTYKANDGVADSNTATVTITVNPVNDPPEANDDVAQTDEDIPVAINVLANDTDVDGDALTVESVTQGTNGTVTINADGTVTYSPNPGYSGTDTFTYAVSDGNGGTDMATVTVTVIPANNPPVVFAGGPYSVDEGGSVTVTASGSDPDGDPLTYAWDLDNDGTFETPGQSVTFSAAGLDGPSSHTIAVQVTDDGGLSATDQATVDVQNVAPTATFANTSGTINEGESATLVFSDQFDPSTADAAAGFRYSYDCTNDGTFELSDDPAASFVCHYPDNGTFTVRGRIKDKDGGFTDYTVEVTVNNVAPTVGEITAPLDPVEVNTTINASADFTDPGMLDTHTAIWEWGDDSTSAGTVNEANGSGSVTGSHTYTTPGVYTVKLTVTDKDGDSGESVFDFIVIYDPEGGFVTGGGWINSPEGAYAPDPSLTGKANFGFVSKYKKGAETPTGETEFQFKAGNLNFHSDSYEWLVVANHKAMYKGVGTINGSGNYGFMLSAIDEKLTPSTDVDLFRIKIWDKDDDDTIVYDNQMGAEDDADPTTAIGGGNIVIHK